MSAVATRPRAKSTKAAQLEVVPVEPNETADHPYWYELTVAARDALGELLKAMREHDDFEEDDRCCDALRVVSVASDLINQNLIDASVLDMEAPQLHIANVGFDACALLIAATCYQDQDFGRVRSDLSLHATRILGALTDLHSSGPDGLRFAPALQAAIEAAEDGRPGVKQQRDSAPVGRKTGDRTETGAEDKASTEPLWVSADAVLNRLDDMRTLLDIIGDECGFNFEDAAQSLRAQERISLLVKAAEHYVDAAAATASALTDSLQAVTGDRQGAPA
jgi:hypothetical protein